MLLYTVSSSVRCKYVKISGIGHTRTSYVRFTLTLYFCKYTMFLTILLKCVFHDDWLWKPNKQIKWPTNSVSFAKEYSWISWKSRKCGFLIKKTRCPFYKCSSRCVTAWHLSSKRNPSSRHNASLYWCIALLDRLKYPMSLTILLKICV